TETRPSTSAAAFRSALYPWWGISANACKIHASRASQMGTSRIRRYEMYAAQIQTGELRPQDLPTTYGDWSDYARFAVTFAPRDREGCREFATSAFARWRRTGEVPRMLQELRACLWFEQRRWRFMGREPDAAGMQYAAALIRAMRAQF